MKRTIIFVSIFLTIGIFALFNQVQGETIVTTTTEIQTTSEALNFEDKMYYYTGYQDLISQIYADVHDDIYEQIKAGVVEDLTEEFYDEIYESVQTKLAELLSEEELELYVADFQDQLYDVINFAENSVFGITNYTNDNEVTIGSGVVYKYDETENLYYLITNYHVIENGASYEIRFEDESTVEANVLGYDTEVDIAVVTFSGTGLDFIEESPLGESSLNEVSEFILAIGNPIGYNFYNSATLGIISGVEREVDANRYIEYIQHDAAINGGNSGGPIYNLEGEVIGINVSKFANVEVEGMGFAIPIDLVKRIVERIEDGTLTVNTIMPRIGCSYYTVEDLIDNGEVFLESLTVNGSLKSDLTITLPENVTGGIIVNQPVENCTLEDYLKSGDLIVQINTHIITSEDNMEDYLYKFFESGDYIMINYYEFNETTYSYSDTISQVLVLLK